MTAQIGDVPLEERAGWLTIILLTLYLGACIVGSSVAALSLFVDQGQQTTTRPAAAAKQDAATPSSDANAAPSSARVTDGHNCKFLLAMTCGLQDSKERQLLAIVMLLGLVGASVHAVTSLATYVGNRRLRRSWALWYLMRPPIGLALALVMYLVVRGGFLGQVEHAEELNRFAFGAVGALAGMFSKRAVDKLSEVFEEIFQVKKGAGDDSRLDKAVDTTPVNPQISTLDPAELSATASAGTMVTINGSGFTEDAVVLADRDVISATLMSPQKLQFQMTADRMAGKTEISIQVRVGGPSGAVSNVAVLKVT